MHGVGMNECNLETEEPTARSLVDQPRALARECRDRHRDIVDGKGDVVHAGTAARDEASDRRVVAGRGEQLDPVPADEHRRRLGAL